MHVIGFPKLSLFFAGGRGCFFSLTNDVINSQFINHVCVEVFEEGIVHGIGELTDLYSAEERSHASHMTFICCLATSVYLLFLSFIPPALLEHGIEIFTSALRRNMIVFTPGYSRMDSLQAPPQTSTAWG